MDEELSALLLLNMAGADARALRRAAASGASAVEIVANPDKFAAMLPKNAAAKINKNAGDGWAEREYERTLNMGARLIGLGTSDYPDALTVLEDAPLVLYWHGCAKSLPSDRVGIVGTRRATEYGRQISYALGSGCASRGTAVISGGAYGIDGKAHEGACDAGGQTFAVFGTGIDVYFPSVHAELFRRIRAHGALISEFPLGTGGSAWHFPRRNRIVAALSRKLVVVEAPHKSGAMITARMALELGVEIWAVPGRIGEKNSEGPNRLIYDGAYPLIDTDMFFGVQYGECSSACGTCDNNAKTAPKLPDEEASVLLSIKEEGGMTVDNIALKVKMSAAEVLKITAVLSAEGYIYASGPGRFSAKI